MQIDPSLAGTSLKEYRCTLSARRSMNYAAAIPDPNPCYFDDERSGGIIAPPMQAVTLTWPIFEHFSEFLPDRSIPPEALATQVHYTEHLVFHRPLKPGDDLTIRGCIAAILPHRAGAHVIIRLDALDARGNPVFTEYNGGLVRGVACSAAGNGGENLPVLPRPATAASLLWQAQIPIDPMAPFIYDGCAQIHFPIHTSVKFARSVGLPGIILQGTATLALAAREMVNREAHADPRCLKVLSARFSAMVLPGEVITVRLDERRTDAGGCHLFFRVFNADGGQAITHGYARIEASDPDIR